MSINFDLSGIRRAALRAAGTVAAGERAMQRAQATVARRVLPFAKRDIQQEYNLPAARAAKDLAIERRTANEVMLVGYARPIGKIEFSGHWGGRRTAGATAQVKKGGARKTYDGAFVAVGNRGDRGKGNRHIFERTSAKRLPIQPLYGPSMAQMLRRPGRAERIGDFAHSVLASEIKRGLG